MLVIKNLFRVIGQERQIQEKREPVTVDQEQNRENAVNCSFRDDVCIEAVAKVNGVDVITFQIAIHDGKKHLEEEVYGVYQHGQ